MDNTKLFSPEFLRCSGGGNISSGVGAAGGGIDEGYATSVPLTQPMGDEHTMMAFSQQGRGGGNTPGNNNLSTASATAPSSSSGAVNSNELLNQTWATLRRKGGKQEEFRLNYRIINNIKDSYTLGRSRGCDIHVDHKCVSSRHCTIYCDYTQARMRVFIEDNSVNGTFINDALTKISRGERMELRSGDEIYLINPRNNSESPVGTSTSAPNPGQPGSDNSVASFIFVNIRDRIAANREITVAPKHPNHLQPTVTAADGSDFTTGPSSSTVGSIGGAVSLNDQSIQRHIEDYYIIGDKIGSGMSGQVYFCINRFTKKRCAVKEIDLRKVHMNPGMSVEDMKEEAKLMQQLKHPGIIQVFDTFQTPNALYIVMELVEGGDLFDRIVERGHYSEDNARLVMRNVLSAVEYLHSKNIIHRDLKPENILLVSPKDDTQIKVTDFGLAKKASHEGLRTFCGTPQYFAPEVLRRKTSTTGLSRYGTSADMWSLGVVLYIMLSGTFPFDEVDLFDQIEKAQYNFVGPEWQHASVGAKHFIRSLLQLRVDKRLTVEQALKHPWIQGIESPSSGGMSIGSMSGSNTPLESPPPVSPFSPASVFSTAIQSNVAPSNISDTGTTVPIAEMPPLPPFWNSGKKSVNTTTNITKDRPAKVMFVETDKEQQVPDKQKPIEFIDLTLPGAEADVKPLSTNQQQRQKSKKPLAQRSLQFVQQIDRQQSLTSAFTVSSNTTNSTTSTAPSSSNTPAPVMTRPPLTFASKQVSLSVPTNAQPHPAAVNSLLPFSTNSLLKAAAASSSSTATNPVSVSTTSSPFTNSSNNTALITPTASVSGGLSIDVRPCQTTNGSDSVLKGTTAINGSITPSGSHVATPRTVIATPQVVTPLSTTSTDNMSVTGSTPGIPSAISGSGVSSTTGRGIAMMNDPTEKEANDHYLNIYAFSSGTDTPITTPSHSHHHNGSSSNAQTLSPVKTHKSDEKDKSDDSNSVDRNTSIPSQLPSVVWPMMPGSYIAMEKEVSGDEIEEYSDHGEGDGDNTGIAGNGSSRKKKSNGTRRRKANLPPTVNTSEVVAMTESVAIKKDDTAVIPVMSTSSSGTTQGLSSKMKRQQSLIDAWGISASTSNKIRKTESTINASSSSTVNTPAAATIVESDSAQVPVQVSSTPTIQFSSRKMLRVPTNSLTTLFKNATKICLSPSISTSSESVAKSMEVSEQDNS